VAWVLKTTAILLVILCAASLGGVSARAASDAAFRQRLCLALAERIWPQTPAKSRNTIAIGTFLLWVASIAAAESSIGHKLQEGRGRCLSDYTKMKQTGRT
jgi:hypothetical protein